MQPLSFGEQLTALMKRRACSIARLTLLMGGKSKTDVARVMHDQTSQAKREAFYQKLESLQIVEDTELAPLREGLEVSRIGKQEYNTQKAIRSLLSDTHADDCGVTLDNGRRLDEETREWIGADSVRIICFNSCWYGVFAALQPLLENPQADVILEHYIAIDTAGNDAAEILASVAPVLNDWRYQLCTIDRDRYENEARLLAPNLISARVQRQGQTQEFVYAFRNGGEGLVGDSPISSFVRRMLDSVRACIETVKTIEGPLRTGDYAAFLNRCLMEESNRALYQFRLDPCMPMIPTRIARHAIEEGCLPREQTEALITSLAAVHESRFRNIFTKKQVTYFLLSRKGMRRFMETGHMCDHFFAMRDFTPIERWEILHHLTQQATENPVLFVRFVKDEDLFGKCQYIVMEQLGVLIVPMQTGYDQGKEYSETMLTYPSFTRQFKDFFFRYLLSEKTLSDAETLNVLRELERRYYPREV